MSPARAQNQLLGPRSPFRVALIGAGRVGGAIAEHLRRRGHEIVGVASRTPESASRAARMLGSRTFRPDDDPAPEADVLLVAVPDEAIGEQVARLLPMVRAGVVVWHVSGSLALDPLTPALERGALACAVHPMQACPTIEAALANLPGSAWGVTVSPGLEAWAHRLVSEDLSGVPVGLAAEHRGLWHAASVTTSTGVNAVMALGEALLLEIGVTEPQRALGPLVAGTIDHSLSQGGARAALTGPVVRGERGPLERHREALRSAADGSLLPDYLIVARLVLERAVAAGKLDGGVAARMRDLLADHRAP
ncbi:MAG: Rossmann-like and DUF2520 domain-containing protein [Actinomycetota bacterium]